MDEKKKAQAAIAQADSESEDETSSSGSDSDEDERAKRKRRKQKKKAKAAKKRSKSAGDYNKNDPIKMRSYAKDKDGNLLKNGPENGLQMYGSGLHKLNYNFPIYGDFLKESAMNHIDSFDVFMKHSLDAIPKEITPVEVPLDESGKRYMLVGIEKLSIAKPEKLDAASLPKGNKARGDWATNKNVYPTDCREGHFTYAGKCTATVWFKTNDSKAKNTFQVDMGHVPVMIGSDACHLKNKKAEELVRLKEDEQERGGFFIINGNEKIIRMLIQQKANYAVALHRESFLNRGDQYTPYAVQVRSMRSDQTTMTNTIHYMNDGSVQFRFSFERNEYFMPFLAVCYACAPEELREFQMAKFLLQGNDDDFYAKERITMMQQMLANCDFETHGKAQALNFLGDRFRHTNLGRPPFKRMSDFTLGSSIIKRFVLPHCTDPMSKLHMLAHMYNKLLLLATEKIKPDNVDALSTQEVLTPGQVYGAVFKEALESGLDDC